MSRVLSVLITLALRTLSAPPPAYDPIINRKNFSKGPKHKAQRKRETRGRK